MINFIEKKIKKTPRFVRFMVVGVVNTAIDLGVLNILIVIFGLTQPFLFSFYKSISFICALLNSYFMNKSFTFGIKENKQKTFYLFILFSLIGFMVNVTSSSLVFYALSLSKYYSVHLLATISGIAGTILGLFINYLSYKYIVFK